MKKLTTTLLLILSFFVVFGQTLEARYQPAVSGFINAVKSKNVNKLADRVAYPLEREYPLPAIKNKQEFIKRYKEVFDDQLIKMIVNSKPAKDWSQVGWRGIMLFQGDLWLDDDGTLRSVNHQSAVERKNRAVLIAREKSGLHESIKVFKDPVLVFETAKFRIRIDDLGNHNYRYASWPLKSKMSDQPDLILKKGEWVPEGSGGNHRFDFKSGNFLYSCWVMEMGGKDTPPAILTIYKANKEILSQDATTIKN
ncbi:hypothetical protein DBR43_07505 [Pedobacter sp. KBW06]|uniref:hypothetical protein n=1 Tax=Pedobacter sp. KBW06 TaxID=2153359 RepID=UPI000F59B4DB|nr:hypothetical protein [Pedobacter sp. KBW06]RQO75203.1 hypothetical protein DBR43_07505 [Pedobacter sp. KBW06]